MTGPVNPILVVKTNLPDYKADLLKRRAQHVSILAAIDDELVIIERLELAVE